MKSDITVIRVDPDTRTIAKIRIRPGHKPAAGAMEVRRVCRAKRIGSRELMTIDDVRQLAPNPRHGKPGEAAMVDVGGTPLMVGGGLDVDENMRGWRLKGGEDTAGIGMLFGRGAGGGMVSAPVDVEWVSQRIVWLDREDMARTEEAA